MKSPRFTDRDRYPHGYVPAERTDIRKTFARVQQERDASAEQREWDERMQQWMREALPT